MHTHRNRVRNNFWKKLDWDDYESESLQKLGHTLLRLEVIDIFYVDHGYDYEEYSYWDGTDEDENNYITETVEYEYVNVFIESGDNKSQYKMHYEEY